LNFIGPKGDFTVEERIANKANLTGVFPIDLVLNEDVKSKLEEYFVPPLLNMIKIFKLCGLFLARL
jgi:hypothetical protein